MLCRKTIILKCVTTSHTQPLCCKDLVYICLALL